MLHVQTCIATNGEHDKCMSYTLPPQDEGFRALGMSLLLERVKKFFQTIQKDYVELFLLSVLCLMTMF